MTKNVLMIETDGDIERGRSSAWTALPDGRRDLERAATDRAVVAIDEVSPWPPWSSRRRASVYSSAAMRGATPLTVDEGMERGPAPCSPRGQSAPET